MTNELIDMQYLALYFGEILGSDFVTEINSRERITGTEGKIVCTIKANRVPFAIADVKSETFRVIFDFYGSVDGPEKKHKFLQGIQKILGYMASTIDTTEEPTEDTTKLKLYRIVSNLELQAPMGNPQIDSSDIMANYQITGTILVSAVNSGAVIGNDIHTYISTKPFSETNKGDEIATLSVQTQLDKTAEAPLINSSSVGSTLLLGQINTIALSALFLNREIDKTIIKNIYKCDDGNLTQNYYIKRVFNDLVIIKKCYLLQGTVMEQAGAYTQYQAVFQDVQGGEEAE